MMWTPEQDDTLRELVLSGISYSEMCERFGVTRNACIGRAHRLGMKKGRPVAAVAKHVPPAKPKRVNIIETHRVRAVLAKREIEELRIVDIIPRGVKLMDLTPHDCRYPYGMGPFTFCGHPVVEGRTYCAGHFALCWREPAKRNVEKPSYRRAA